MIGPKGEFNPGFNEVATIKQRERHGQVPVMDGFHQSLHCRIPFVASRFSHLSTHEPPSLKGHISNMLGIWLLMKCLWEIRLLYPNPVNAYCYIVLHMLPGTPPVRAVLIALEMFTLHASWITEQMSNPLEISLRIPPSPSPHPIPNQSIGFPIHFFHGINGGSFNAY